jgi:uncharacterized membrane protein YcfT
LLDRPGRIAWIDATRGLAILCIVVYHTLLWYFLSDPGRTWAPSYGFWSRFNSMLGSLRVPLLLMVSGMVTSHRVLGGLADRTNVSRAGTNYYLYVVWLAIYAAFFALVPGAPLPHRISSWPQLFTELLVPDTTLWYLVALAVYILITAVTARLPRALVLVFALASYLAADLFLPTELQATKIPQNWLFFLIGAYLAPALHRLARFATLPIIAASAVVSAVVIQVGGVLPEVAAIHSVHSIVRSLVMVTTATLAAIWLTRITWFRTGLAYLGSRTLAIYLLHPLLIYSVIALATAFPIVDGLRTTMVGSTLGPIVITAAIVWAGLALRRGAGVARADWLFVRPRWLTRRTPADTGPNA